MKKNNKEIVIRWIKFSLGILILEFILTFLFFRDDLKSGLFMICFVFSSVAYLIASIIKNKNN
jgi:ABC-type iron transport system FetAB permease component